ncbi:MAG: acyltransferase [Lachnospiraceae bacterium]|nr:acyltransferase [Candidatus Colinaster scatohippi]
MSSTKTASASYRFDLDILKGIAIIAVVLYHVGVCEAGYLGVDAFFVINGFLIIPSIYKQLEGNKFSYFKFVIKRVKRLYPLVIIACAVTLLMALIAMVPDDLLTVSEMTIASSVFCNNILSYILFGDYWDWTNDFKPLMHTWYLGVLVEFYLVVPIIMLLVYKLAGRIKKDSRILLIIVMAVISVVSFFTFIPASVPAAFKFHLFISRLFEFLSGGIVGLIAIKNNNFEKKNGRQTIFLILTAVGALALIVGGMLAKNVNNKLMLPVTVIYTLVLIILGQNTGKIKCIGLLAQIGTMSYSIYIWHQVFLAYYRYYYSTSRNVIFWIIFVLTMIIVTLVSYYLIETRVKLDTGRSILGFGLVLIIIWISSACIWRMGGIIRDVPELNTYVNKSARRQNSQYVDRIYDMDRPFSEDGRKKILVVGNSFARDFANILLESEYAQKIDLSYSFSIPTETDERLARCDIAFIYFEPSAIPQYFIDSIETHAKLYGIGDKNFGQCIGQYTIHRFSADYYNQTGLPEEINISKNERMKEFWGENYIDLMQAVSTDDGHVRVFTDDNCFISYDCKHLTKAGTSYYAKILDLECVLCQ